MSTIHAHPTVAEALPDGFSSGRRQSGQCLRGDINDDDSEKVEEQAVGWIWRSRRPLSGKDFRLQMPTQVPPLPRRLNR